VRNLQVAQWQMDVASGDRGGIFAAEKSDHFRDRKWENQVLA
jgi:hypothetical protein